MVSISALTIGSVLATLAAIAEAKSNLTVSVTALHGIDVTSPGGTVLLDGGDDGFSSTYWLSPNEGTKADFTGQQFELTIPALTTKPVCTLQGSLALDETGWGTAVFAFKNSPDYLMPCGDPEGTGVHAICTGPVSTCENNGENLPVSAAPSSVDPSPAGASSTVKASSSTVHVSTAPSSK